MQIPQEEPDAIYRAIRSHGDVGRRAARGQPPAGTGGEDVDGDRLPAGLHRQHVGVHRHPQEAEPIDGGQYDGGIPLATKLCVKTTSTQVAPPTDPYPSGVESDGRANTETLDTPNDPLCGSGGCDVTPYPPPDRRTPPAASPFPRDPWPMPLSGCLPDAGLRERHLPRLDVALPTGRKHLPERLRPLGRPPEDLRGPRRGARHTGQARALTTSGSVRYSATTSTSSAWRRRFRHDAARHPKHGRWRLLALRARRERRRQLVDRQRGRAPPGSFRARQAHRGDRQRRADLAELHAQRGLHLVPHRAHSQLLPALECKCRTSAASAAGRIPL